MRASTLCNPSVSCFPVILGLPGPCFPSTCLSKAILTAPLERSTCPYQQSLLSFCTRSSSSMPCCANSSLDLVVTMSCGLTLQICLIIALSFCCRRWRFGFVNGQVSLAWSIALSTQELYTWPRVLKERWRDDRTGSKGSVKDITSGHKSQGSNSRPWTMTLSLSPHGCYGFCTSSHRWTFNQSLETILPGVKEIQSRHEIQRSNPWSWTMTLNTYISNMCNKANRTLVSWDEIFINILWM